MGAMAMPQWVVMALAFLKGTDPMCYSNMVEQSLRKLAQERGLKVYLPSSGSGERHNSDAVGLFASEKQADTVRLLARVQDQSMLDRVIAWFKGKADKPRLRKPKPAPVDLVSAEARQAAPVSAPGVEIKLPEQHGVKV
jgi:hypothetical protein